MRYRCALAGRRRFMDFVDMSPILIVHIGAGGLGILSGYAAVSVRKGERLHRVFGTVFFLSMLTVSTLAVYLALFVPPIHSGGAPPSASVSVGVLTFYLAATAWMTVKRKDGRVGLFEKGALAAVLGVAVALLIFGLRAASIPAARPALFVPFFVFASFAAFASAMDLKVILRGGISGAPRIARHLWRMCFALFFAAAFFFLGQQGVMPKFMRGSPILFVPALAPLVFMFFWLFRVRLTNWFTNKSVDSSASSEIAEDFVADRRVA
jgi:hypothetical protein